MDAITKAIETIKKYNMLNVGDKVIAGISGGADSVCLLHVLKEIEAVYNLKIVAVHINHNIRGEAADADERFVKELCLKLNVEFISFSVQVEDIAREKGLTVEEAGRMERYKAFNSLNPDKIAVAHNMNDNCETILMRLFRGSGIKGLAGIAPVRDNIIRPLINVSRDEIEEFCRKNSIGYCTDSTNSDDTYTRNKIRLHLLPWIKENLNSNIMACLCKTGNMVCQDEDYLYLKAKEEYENAVTKDNALCVEKLKTLHPSILSRVIRIVCENTASSLKDISYDHINMIIALMDKESGKKVNLPYGITALKDGNTIKIYKETDLTFDCILTEDKPIYIKECKKYFLLSRQTFKRKYAYVFDSSKIKGSVHIRTRRDGDIFAAKKGSKKLKKILIDMKIPVYQRSFMPLAADDENVFCIIGKKTDSSYFTGNNNIYLYTWEE